MAKAINQLSVSLSHNTASGKKKSFLQSLISLRWQNRGPMCSWLKPNLRRGEREGILTGRPKPQCSVCITDEEQKKSRAGLHCPGKLLTPSCPTLLISVQISQ